MQSKRYIHCSQELQKTTGHVTMSDYNLLMSVEIGPAIGHDDRTNHVAKTVILSNISVVINNQTSSS